MHPTQPTYILRIKEVCALLKLSKSTVYAKLKEGCQYYDPSFPKPIKLSAVAIGWTHQSIVEWITARTIEAQ